MKLILPDPVALKIVTALASAKKQEIGGLLVGEHVENETFRVIDASVQTTHGTSVHFERDPACHADFLANFFERTGAEFTQFNYLGEWHSHPSFDPLPSRDDLETMKSIVHDPAVGVNFAILLIVRRDGRRRLSLSATAFSKFLPPERVTVESEPASAPQERRGMIASALECVRYWLS